MDEVKSLSNHELHNKMVDTSQRERQITAQMITLIEEADRRKFFLDVGFATLFEYLTDGLKYSAGAAMRRISTARLSRELPEVKERVVDGSLSLSNLSQAEKFFRNEAKNERILNVEEKREVLKQIENQSVREAEKTLIGLSCAPEQLQQVDKIKPVTPEVTQITFTANAEFMDQLEEVRGLLAHRMPEATLTEVMAELMKLGLAGLRKRKFSVSEEDRGDRKSKRDGESKREEESKSQPVDDLKKEEKVEEKNSQEAIIVSGAGNDSDYIPAPVRREVYGRDRGRCAVVRAKTGKVCGSKYKVEFDHFPIPRAMGGPSTVTNLRLACRNCNVLHAVRRFGIEKVVYRR